MKKKLLLGLLIGAAPFMLAACGKDDSEKSKKEESSDIKNITCEGKDSGNDISVKLSYNTKKKELESGSMTYVMDLSSYDSEVIAELKNMDLCDEFEGEEMFSSCKSSTSDKALKVDLAFDIEKLYSQVADDEEEKEDLDELVSDLEDTLAVECSIK